MRANFFIFREALRKYMPDLHYRTTVSLSVFALIYLAAQTELGRASSGGITPLVAATVVHLVLAIGLTFQAMMPRIMACERVVRDGIFACVALTTALLVTILLLTNSDLLAKHLYSLGCMSAALIFAYGAVRTELLVEYMPWAWRGLHRGLKGAAIIMALLFLASVAISEWMIAYANTPLWVLMRVVWPILGLKLAHVAVISHQLWLRRNAMRAGTPMRREARRDAAQDAARHDSAA